jgi:hypothetical protein
MFRALNLQTSQAIISLDPQWRSQVGYLRTLGKSDLLVCPWCRQPVRLRTGSVRRWHFAHKHLENCPSGRDSPLILAVRAMLYDWLVAAFGSQRVTLEAVFDPPLFPRPVDCWVETGNGPVGYWIFDKQLTPALREQVKTGFTSLSAQAHYGFAARMLRQDGGLLNRVHLTTTERDFMGSSLYDRAWARVPQDPGGSLHYLDPDEGILTTFRDLRLLHKPQLYNGVRKSNPLPQISASPTNGEFIHPGESLQLQIREREIESQQRKAAQRQQKIAAYFASRAARAAGAATSTNPPKIPASPPVTKSPLTHEPFARQGTCRVCGEITSDWVTYFGKSDECICRNCARKANQG